VTRVTVVSPEPTPYRAPLFDRIAQRVELTVVYAAPTVAGRDWTVSLNHRAVFLHGVRVPGMRKVVRHDYPLTPGIVRALRESRPDVVVVSGWSTFASLAAVTWCRAHRIPYVLHVESHDLDPRPAWRRRVKDTVATPIIRGAASVLAVGSAARDSVVARGAKEVRVFANTIDVDRWIERADLLTRTPHDGIAALSVGRDVPEKGFDVLTAAAAAADVRLEIVTAGLSEDELAQHYVDADVFALLSRHEPWGVVVNEAAASGLPLVLSERVGAAHDLLRDGENGFLVPADDVPAAADALRKLSDPALRHRMGERSRELVRAWSYDASVEAFLEATSL
jgi:glycosyltransferase involved in cell wall biosynthesis